MDQLPELTSTAPRTVENHPAGKKHRIGFLIAGGVTAVALGIGGGGVALGAALASANNASTIEAGSQSTVTPGSYRQTSPFGGSTQGSQSTTTATTATAATSDQKVGVVTILSSLNYSDASQAAGTGIVLTSSGRILTNNHVIEGATSIAVTVESTGKTYVANVVGSDTVDDIAVLQLVDASGLSPATIDTDTVKVADAATSIGNAEGTGDLVAAAGTVTALDESITVGNEETGTSENLTGLIEIDADVVSGDSGGPLIDSEGEVMGIVTAASSGSTDITGFAIPINTAMTIAKQIIAGDGSGNVTIGLPAFLGVQIATTQGTTGVTVAGVLADTPAAAALIAAGYVITSVDGTAVTTPTELSAAISAHAVGDSVVIGYTTAAGAATSVTVTLTAGPAA